VLPRNGTMRGRICLLPHPMWIRCCLGLLMATLAAVAAPACAQGTGVAITAVRLAPGERLVLDGSLSHPAWQRAPIHAGFVEKDPINGAEPSQATRVQVLFDEKAIYVGVTALDTAPALIRDQIVRADSVNRTQDFVGVYIDAIGQRSSAQFFRVNAAGSTADGMHTAADDNEDFAPDFDWDAATARISDGTAEGWTAVLRLPFASLRFAIATKDGKQDWRIMVIRRLPREQFHLFTSTPIPRDASSFIATLQPLVGVELPQQHGFLTVRPSVTLRSARNDGVKKNDIDTSIDIKWRPIAEAVIDATINPDFSQVALDVPQLAGNTSFAIYLPEKRPFFFESADLLRMPTDALYTRSFTQPRWGLRTTWRAQDWAGSAFAINDKGGGLVLLPGPYGTDGATQPASQTLAARVRSDGQSLSWGGVMAARRYDQGRGDNQVLGPDFLLELSEQWRLRGQWLHARTSARAVGADSGHTVLQRGPGIDGDRVWLRLSRQTGSGETGIVVDDIGHDFRHDSGFVNQAGVRIVDVFQSKGWQGLGPFNEFYINVKAFQARDRRTGEVVQEYLRPGLWGSGARNAEGWFEVFVHSALRTAAHKPLLHERFVSTGGSVSPASWFPVFEVSLDAGRLADTSANTVRRGGRLNLSAKLRPLAPLEFEPSIKQAWLDGDVAGQGQRVYREQALQMLAVWHFDASHNVRAIVQRSALDRRAEPGVSSSDFLNRVESLTYTWRRSSGTRLFVGATRSRDGRASASTTTTEAFVKLQFDTDEMRTLWQ
jgi:Domain of unknown function (DUF5916)